MTRERASPDDDPSMETEAHETLLKSLRDAGAPDERIGEAAWDCLAHLLMIERRSSAAMHACEYEAFWDDGRKLEILERMQAAGMGSFAVQLCHRWKLSELCEETRSDLYRELFPKLPPRADKKERP